MICRKLFKVGPTSNYTVFRLPCGDKSSVQGFQFYVLKFFPLSKRIFEGFELVLTVSAQKVLSVEDDKFPINKLETFEDAL